MAITFPRTDVIEALYQDQPFELMERQEISRSQGGTPYAKSLSEAIWTVSMQTVPMHNDDSLDFVAILRSLDGSIGTFTAHDLRRPYPREYPDGNFTDSGKLKTINENNKAVSLKGLPASFKVSRGDYFSFNFGSGRRALHQAMESVTADGSGDTTEFEVRPHIRPGVALSPDVSVVFKKPSAIFVMEPGSLRPSRLNAIHEQYSFSAVQVP